MLKELFESSFYITFPPVTHTIINLIEQIHTGAFSLADIKACDGCKFVCSSDVASREQLRITSNQEVYIINIDQVVSHIKDTVGETCDYMLDTNASTILVEMTCSTADNVLDKRPKARRQLRNTLALLFANDNIKQHINKKSTNYVVFSWKETFSSTVLRDNVEHMMRGMLEMADEVYSPNNESSFDFDFKFKEIRYPHALSM